MSNINVIQQQNGLVKLKNILGVFYWTIALLLSQNTLLCSFLECASSQETSLTQSLSFDGADLVLDLPEQVSINMEAVDLRARAGTFATSVKERVKKAVNIEVGYCHFYEDAGLWYCRMEAQSATKMTQQMAEFAVTKTVETFLQALSDCDELLPFMHVLPISLYHLQLVINAPDEKGYISEVSTWKGEVAMHTDKTQEVTTYTTLYQKNYPNKALPSFVGNLSHSKQNMLFQDVFPDLLRTELQAFWLEKGYVTSNDTWGYFSRFHLPKNQATYFLNLQSTPTLEREIINKHQEIDFDMLTKRFRALRLEWKQWLVDKKIISSASQDDTRVTLRWQVQRKLGHHSGISVFNVGNKLCIYSPRHCVANRLFAIFGKKTTKEYYVRDLEETIE